MADKIEGGSPCVGVGFPTVAKMATTPAQPCPSVASLERWLGQQLLDGVRAGELHMVLNDDDVPRAAVRHSRTSDAATPPTKRLKPDDVTDPMLSIEAVGRMVGLADVTIYRKITDGTFPQQTHVSARRVGWPRSTIETWLAARPMGRQKG